MSLQAFGWAYVNNWHNTWEQFYVYWICPFIGAILAAWVFRETEESLKRHNILSARPFSK